MSNGFAGVGHLTVDQTEGKVELGISQWWTSMSSGTEVLIELPGHDRYSLEMSYDETRQLAALLLEATGDHDLAKAIPEAQAQLAEKERIRQEAYTALREAETAAEEQFVKATSSQRSAYNDTLAMAEQAYERATGEATRLSRRVRTTDDPVNQFGV